MITNREDFKRYLDWRGQRAGGGESRRATVKGEKTKLSEVIHSYRRRAKLCLVPAEIGERERERDETDKHWELKDRREIIDFALLRFVARIRRGEDGKG